jgi:cation efflux system protein
LNQALPKFWENVKIFLNHAPEDLAVEKLKTELELIEDIAFIPQLNIWTTDGIEKCAMIYICLKNPQKIQETKQAVHQLLKAYDISRVTIECDESLAEHKAHGNMDN